MTPARKADAGVEDLDLPVGLVQVHIVLHVAAVGDHDAHADAEGEEELAHGVQHHVQKAPERHAGEVGLQIEGKALKTGAGHAAVIRVAQRQREHGDPDDEKQQDRHDIPGIFLNALLHAAIDHPRSQCQKQQHKDNRRDLRGDEGGKEAILSCLGSVRDQIDREILSDPAADDGVVGHDEGRNQEGQITQKTPLLMQSPEGVQCVLLGPAADGHVRGQQCEAEGQHQHQIHQQEQAAAVLGAEIGEAPDIADAYGTTCGRQNEAQRAAETTVFVFHFAHSFLSFCLQRENILSGCGKKQTAEVS